MLKILNAKPFKKQENSGKEKPGSGKFSTEDIDAGDFYILTVRERVYKWRANLALLKGKSRERALIFEAEDKLSKHTGKSGKFGCQISASFPKTL